MRRSGADVVAAWGLGNAVLLGVHFWYGGGVAASIPFALYGGAVLLIELVAVAALWTARRYPEMQAQSPAPRSSRVALLGGAAAVFIIAGFVYRPWMMIPAVYPALGIVAELVSSSNGAEREEASASTTSDTPEQIPEATPETHRKKPLLAAFAVSSAALAALAARRRNAQ